MDVERLICDRARAVDASGIRRVFELGATLADPIDLSIGQPDFPVPEAIKRAAIDAIDSDHNGYTRTQGVGELLDALAAWIQRDVGWTVGPAGSGEPTEMMVTSGTSGALMLAFLSLLGPGDEAIIPDPYFVIYPHLARICGGRAVLCQTYPDLQMTAERVEPLITDRTRLVLLNSPSNPGGAVASVRQCRDLLELCRSRGVLLISDEIYDEFTYAEARTDHAAGDQSSARCPSPGRFACAHEDMLLVRGFGKTYGITGWRMGWAAGPRALIEQMAKLQQYTFVCAPAPAQWGSIAALDEDMSGHVAAYQRRRDLVVQRLGAVTDLPRPGGAFYAFVRIPEALGLSGGQFVERCIERNVLVIPGSVFSTRDTHVRLSYATSEQNLLRGLDVLVELLGAQERPSR